MTSAALLGTTLIAMGPAQASTGNSCANWDIAEAAGRLLLRHRRFEPPAPRHLRELPLRRPLLSPGAVQRTGSRPLLQQKECQLPNFPRAGEPGLEIREPELEDGYSRRRAARTRGRFPAG